MGSALQSYSSEKNNRHLKEINVDGMKEEKGSAFGFLSLDRILLSPNLKEIHDKALSDSFILEKGIPQLNIDFLVVGAHRSQTQSKAGAVTEGVCLCRGELLAQGSSSFMAAASCPLWMRPKLETALNLFQLVALPIHSRLSLRKSSQVVPRCMMPFASRVALCVVAVRTQSFISCNEFLD
ncbi:hypothetical protein WR25_21928 [Diploscapter pachys]|uniref:Uncharacterized protein n=1 Tax=Diploscapter pachys TaxID=2018661 RepID=A0A2A2KYC3_9BILA|nr:hypothetical protein WR25_21928 [Diploscapter pachys]